MKILISNDDGINKAGIKLLEEVSLGFSNDVVVVAPRSNRSGAGHSVTLKDPLRLKKHEENHFSVNGTPTDSVIMGLGHVVDSPPDFIFSGINSDANLAEDITYSGTVAVAMEACLAGIPAISFSQQLDKNGAPKWDVARKFAPIIIKAILERFVFKKNVFLNINFPAVGLDEVNGFKITYQGFREIEEDQPIRCTDPRGMEYFWIGGAEHRRRDDSDAPIDSDIGAINAGYISVTPISLDMTAYGAMEDLKKVFL